MSQAALRAGVTLAAAREVWEIRANATRESFRIGDNTALSEQDKAVALQSLTAKTREAIDARLTPAGATAYLNSPAANWYSYMADGWAVRIYDRGMEMRPITADAKAKTAQRSRGQR